MKRHAALTEGKTYENKSGGSYLCMAQCEDGAIVKNTASGWTCHAHVITMYDDGTIEWDYSTDGHFARR